MARLCPDCRIPMEALLFRDVYLDDCPQCGGIWFDEGELKKFVKGHDELILHSLEDAAKPCPDVVLKERDQKLCPSCSERLTPYRYMYSSDVLLDECDSCYGVWVQDGELEKIADYLDQIEASMTPEKRDILVAASADLHASLRSRKNRAKSLVSYWSLIGQRRTGRPY